MNKTRQSLHGSVSSVVFTLLNGLFNLVVIRRIIQIYGSDFNGLNSTATQFITMLLVVEGGFALAANVSLFAPLSAGDKDRINKILAAVSHRFIKIGAVFCCAGVVVAFLFAFFIKSDLPFEICFWTFMMLVASTGLNLGYATKYKTLFQSDQKEYLLNIISIVFLIISNILLLAAIQVRLPMLILRLIIMLSAIGNSITIALLCKKKYPFLNLHVEPDYSSIRGTSDVFAQKITGVLYYAMPILFISAFDGTRAVSVYAVYNTVFMLIRSFGNAVINAPRMSLGRLIAEEGTSSKHLNNVFDEYELCLVLAISCMLSVSTVTIMQFVHIYTANIADAEYVDWGIAILLTLTCFFECLHIPSGNLINMAGKFKTGRNIQMIAGAVLIVLLVIGGTVYGITGIMVAVLITAVILATLEIGYVRVQLLTGNWNSFIRVFIINAVIGLVLILAECQVNINVHTFLAFFIYAGTLTIINAFTFLGINLLLNNTITVAVLKRFKSLIRLLLPRIKHSDGEDI